jgi:hypothetical protein
MSDEIMKGFQEYLNQHSEERMASIDITYELKDLLKVYIDAEEHLCEKESDALHTLSVYMKKYLEVKEEHLKVSKKLSALTLKLEKSAGTCEGCTKEEGEDE